MTTVMRLRRAGRNARASARRRAAARMVPKDDATAKKRGQALRRRIVICGALFIVLILLKLLLPGNLSAFRATLRSYLVRDADFTAAFAAVGRAVGGEETVGDAWQEACAAVFGTSDAVAVAGKAELAERDFPANAIAEQRVLSIDYAAPLHGAVTSPFGWRKDPNSGRESFHYGVDLAAPEGETIRCFADGVVATVGESTLLGKYLTVAHNGGLSTLYAHCRTVSASSGQKVRCGETVATVGQTGNATGAHLHFEIHSGEEYLNPVYYLGA